MTKEEQFQKDYKKLYIETYQELIELRQVHKQLLKRYEVVSDELLRYYIKYGKEGKNGRSKIRIHNK